jgi:hypothetical protein
MTRCNEHAQRGYLTTQLIPSDLIEGHARLPGFDVLRFRIPLPPPTASWLTFSLAMQRRENLRGLRGFRCESLHCRSPEQCRLYSLSAVFLSTSGLREFGTDFLCN